MVFSMSQEKQKNKVSLLSIIIWLGFVLVAGIFVYPSAMDSYLNISQTAKIGGYSEAVSKTDSSTLQAIKDEAAKYNKDLAELRKTEPYYYQGSSATDEYYESLMRPQEDIDVIAYIEIPSIDVFLPASHGTEYDKLEYELGHMYGTSLPIGGPSTHAVIAGHTGLQNADLFTHLDKVKEGEVFYVHVLNEVHVYTVDQITICLPTAENDYLQIEDGKDYVTLYTCTPYGINDHRLLVRGVRTGDLTPEEVETMQNDIVIKNNKALIKTILFIMIPVLVLIIGALYLFLPRKKKKEEKEQIDDV